MIIKNSSVMYVIFNASLINNFLSSATAKWSEIVINNKQKHVNLYNFLLNISLFFNYIIAMQINDRYSVCSSDALE